MPEVLPTQQPPKRLKMKDLEEATGVGRETIRFYLNQGLLPEPERPARNVAWYDESFVKRILFIKELQKKRYLPLNVIERIVADDGDPSGAEIQALLEIDGKLFPQIEGAPNAKRELVRDAVQRLGLPASDVHKAAQARAIEIKSHNGEDWIEDTSLAILELWAEMRSSGFTTEGGFDADQIGLYVTMVEWLPSQELRLFTRGIAGRVESDEAARMAEVGIDLLNQIIGLLRKKTLVELISRGNLPPHPQRDPA